jgi:hypothetical protein
VAEGECDRREAEEMVEIGAVGRSEGKGGRTVCDVIARGVRQAFPSFWR